MRVIIVCALMALAGCASNPEPYDAQFCQGWGKTGKCNYWVIGPTKRQQEEFGKRNWLIPDNKPRMF
jgi:hypothetical protein